MQAHNPSLPGKSAPAKLLRGIFCALCLLSANVALAADRPVTVLPAEAGSVDRKGDASQPPIGCSRANWLAGKCSNHPATSPPYPDYPTRPPYPDRDPYRRPIIVQPTPAPVEEAPLTDDWEGCRNAKVSQLNSQQNGDRSRAQQLDEWLWKNCRTYSEELRQLEQDRM